MKKDKMCYGDYSNKTDKWLDKRSVYLYEYFTSFLTDEDITMLEELCEVERELTLREEDPR